MRDLIAALALFCASCSTRGEPCSAADACPGKACHMGRCTGDLTPPVPTTTRREVVEASAVTVRSRTARGDEAATMQAGGAVEGSSLLLVTFTAPERPADVVRADLRLRVLDASPPAPSPVELRVATALDPFTEAGPLPRLSADVASATLVAAPGATLRIDVTEALRAVPPGKARTISFAVRARGGDGPGVHLDALVEAPPTLDLYLRDAPAPRAASSSPTVNDARK